MFSTSCSLIGTTTIREAFSLATILAAIGDFCIRIISRTASSGANRKD
jgi:hypothetical protein